MQYVLEMFREYIFAPLIIALCGAVVALVVKYAEKMTRRTTVKDELESLQVSSSIRGTIIDELDKIVQAAVATNMTFVEEMKSSGRKLTDAESEELNAAARTLIMNSLPTDVKDPNGKIMAIIGGEEALNALLKILIEKHVYEYKPQSKQNVAEIVNVFETCEVMRGDEDQVDDSDVEHTYTMENGELVETTESADESQTMAAPIAETTETIPTRIPDVYLRGVG